jgi:hypothetical protein
MAQENGNGNRYPTWRWLAGIVIGILVMIGIGWATSIQGDVKDHTVRLTKTEIQEEEVSKRLDRIEIKLDKVLEKK